MARKKSKTQDYLEAKVLYKMNGVIDLKELWKDEEDKELDGTLADELINNAQSAC